jgi:hypothetical protein
MNLEKEICMAIFSDLRLGWSVLVGAFTSLVTRF